MAETIALDRDTEHLLRELAPQVLGVLVRRFRDFGACEDAVQEALIAAAGQWARDGMPEHPRSWLVQVATRKIADHVRAETARRRRETIVVSLVPPEEQLVMAADSDQQPERDDSLDLLFMSCHPALSAPSAIALTLRAVAGLSTAEIARAFMVPEATMAQRISRAKQTIKTSAVPLELPDQEGRARRLDAVLRVLYLVFNEGYTSSGGTRLHRTDLSNEAIRLTRAVHAQLPGVAEVAGLLALLLLTDARRPARTGPNGELIPLDEQNRQLWDHDQIREGIALINATLTPWAIGEYQVLAAIAAVHDEAVSADATDWAQILALYDVLMTFSDNPIVALNRAVASAMVHGPSAGLDLVRELESDPRLAGNHRLAAVRAHLLERMGDHAAAIAHYLSAAQATTSTPEQNYLIMRAARLREQTHQTDGRLR
ncbi:MAG: sigma-70 family RNA polymerase sigma factor [Deltaproteobacteria bacterium]